MAHSPPPPIQPFDRFQPTDGLLIRADHWVRSHAYHRQRQNLHYQALHQPGIVCGLGVRPIDAPLDIAVEFRDRRWLQIEPGVAIDVFGNPIVVSEPIPYRISMILPPAGSQTVYLVISYVDPETLQRRQPQEFLRETFRLDEKLQPPEAHELELCRIQLQAGLPALDVPGDVLFPGMNQLDLGHRSPVGVRPQAVVRVAQGLYSDPASDRHRESLTCLLEAAQALYPQLQGIPEIGRVQLNAAEPLEPYDLIYVTGELPLDLQATDLNRLRQYLASGGVLLVDTPQTGVALAKRVVAIADQLQIGLRPFDQLPSHHPLRRQPFLFPTLPKIHSHQMRLVVGEGLIMGSWLATGWGLAADPPLPRETLRTAQEFGLNLLHYAWQRRHLTALLGSGQAQAEPRVSPSTWSGIQTRPSPSPVATAPVEAPLAEEAVSVTPAIVSPAIVSPVEVTPTTGSPVVVTPATGSPTTGSPAIGSPVEVTPATGSPVGAEAVPQVPTATEPVPVATEADAAADREATEPNPTEPDPPGPARTSVFDQFIH